MPSAGDACAACFSGTMQVRNGRFGIFLGCSAFPACRHKESVRVGSARGKPKVVVLEMESPTSFRLYITHASRKRPREEDAAHATPSWHPAGPDADERALMELLKTVGVEATGGVGRRADGVLGARKKSLALSEH
ncbi:hypothetical protein T484DRAFT_1856920 [Baffinella frigidus]|nr:hypothetical protein T484DRAFT_1856920 [Cryptophyta sp. CCMP2293]